MLFSIVAVPVCISTNSASVVLIVSLMDFTILYLYLTQEYVLEMFPCHYFLLLTVY